MIDIIKMFIFAFVCSLAVQTMINKDSVKFNMVNAGTFASIVVILKLLVRNLREGIENIPVLEESVVPAVPVVPVVPEANVPAVPAVPAVPVANAAGPVANAPAVPVDRSVPAGPAGPAGPAVPAVPVSGPSVSDKLKQNNLAVPRSVEREERNAKEAQQAQQESSEPIPNQGSLNTDSEISEIVVRLANGNNTIARPISVDNVNKIGKAKVSKLGAGKSTDFVLMDPKYWLDETPLRGICNSGECLVQPVDISGTDKYLRVDQ